MDNLTKSMVQNNLNKLRNINSKEEQREIEQREKVKGKRNSLGKDVDEAQARYRRRVSTLLQFMPEKSHKSAILSDLQISNLIAELPGYYQTSNWERLFNIDVDGCSLITFFQRVKDYDTTIIIIEDTDGWKFGAFCLEEWKPTYSFYGNGENLLFTFKDGNEPHVYGWTGEGEHHQYANNKSIGLGGSIEKGRFALYMADDFYRGSSVKTESYDNEPLAAQTDFKALHFEVWALVD